MVKKRRFRENILGGKVGAFIGHLADEIVGPGVQVDKFIKVPRANKLRDFFIRPGELALSIFGRIVGVFNERPAIVGDAKIVNFGKLF